MRPLRMELFGANTGLPCAYAKVGTAAVAPAIMPRRVKSNVMKSLPLLLFWEEGEPAGADLSTGCRTLDVDPQQVDGLGRGHEQMVPLGAGETEIGAAFGQADAAYQLALRIPHRHPGIAQWRGRAAPDIAGAVGAHAVGAAAHPVHHAIGEDAQVGDLGALDIAHRDAAAADDIDLGVVWREADAVGRLACLERHGDVDPAAGI